jgi:pimeloyl-ACP methyl ester carboxylesterase
VVERQLRDRATLARIAWNPYLQNPRLPHWLHRARMPTLLLWGAQDRLLPPETADLWLRLLPDARLEPIERAGHYPSVEQPERVATLVASFLLPGA